MAGNSSRYFSCSYDGRGHYAVYSYGGRKIGLGHALDEIPDCTASARTSVENRVCAYSGGQVFYRIYDDKGNALLPADGSAFQNLAQCARGL